MTVQRVEVGIVSASDALVAFYRDVFGLTELESRDLPTGMVHRLGNSDAIVKVMVPRDAPSPPLPPAPQFWDRAGLQYFTLWIDDLDDVLARCERAGGAIVLGPLELRPGVRTVLVHDPDGNTIEVMHDASGS